MQVKVLRTVKANMIDSTVTRGPNPDYVGTQ